MRRLWGVLLLLILTRCEPYQNTVVVVATPSCGVFALPDTRTICQLINDNEYLMTSADAVQLRYERLSFTLNGTVYMRIDPQTLTLVTLDGTTVVGANGSTRIIQTGAQLTIALSSDQPLGEPLPYNPNDLNTMVLQVWGDNNVLPSPIAPPADYTAIPTTPPPPTPLSLTDIAIGTAIPQATVCAPRQDWLGTYTIQRGDLLAKIATRYGISLQDLQQSNCILDANRISVGRVLRVPIDLPTATSAVEATLTPSAVAFRADKSPLTLGNCTIIRWDVFNVSAVFLDEAPTTANNIAQVCPSTTTQYTLRVVYPDGTQSTHIVVVEVTQ